VTKANTNTHFVKIAVATAQMPWIMPYVTTPQVFM
jgi:hypothetical protein